MSREPGVPSPTAGGRRPTQGLRWDETHPEDAPWVHARDDVARDGRQFDPEDWSTRLIDVLENRVIVRLEDLSRRVAAIEAELEARRGP